MLESRRAPDCVEAAAGTWRRSAISPIRLTRRDRGLPGGIVESTAACDEETEAEDHPWVDKAQPHRSGQHRRCDRHKAPSSEHDPVTAENCRRGAQAKTDKTNAGRFDEACTSATIR